MYVCVCNAIRETELRAIARAVPGDATQVYAALGRTPQCRQCLDEAGEIIGQARCSRFARRLTGELRVALA